MSNSFSFAAVNYATILFQLGRDEEAIREFRKILIKYVITISLLSLCFQLRSHPSRGQILGKWNE